MYSHSDTYPKRQKALIAMPFIIPFVTRFLRFYQQRFTLSGSDLLCHFVGFPTHSTSPIPQGTFLTFGLTLSHGRSFTSTSLMPQLVQAVILPQHGASADSKGSGNFLRISSVLPTSLHIRRDVFVEIDPPAGLSSIHSPTLGRV